MKPLLIIKTGSTVRRIPPVCGDFEDWISATLQLTDNQVVVVDVAGGEPLPAAQNVAGAVITGSSAMVSDRLDWSEATASWLADAADNSQLPILGICYGHQLLAHALGGTVAYHPNGREIGTTSIYQTVEARNDELFQGLPESFSAHVSHMQSVICLPPDARILAENDFDPHHAVRFRNRVWGVQFHPEFNADVMQSYIDERQDDLVREGFSVASLRAQVHDTADVLQLMLNFRTLLQI